MAEQWEIEESAKLLRMARFLLTKADSHGLSHGEKHYLIQTALSLLSEVQTKLGAPGGRSDWRNEVTVLNADDIPF